MLSQIKIIKKVKSQNKKLLFFLGVIILVGMGLFFAPAVFAQINTNYQEIALGKQNLLDTVQLFINIFLGLLSLIAVVLILIGGFVWMTSGGNDEKIAKAKKILKNALIGLVIIFASWAIVLYIFSLLAETTDQNGNSGNASGGGGSFPPSGSDFYVLSTVPEADAIDTSLCAIAVRMSKAVDKETVVAKNFYLRIYGGRFDTESCNENKECGSSICQNSVCVGDNVAGVIGFGPGEFSDNFSLMPENDLEKQTEYEATVVGNKDGVISADTTNDGVYDQVAMGASYVWRFTTGSEKDEISPTVVQNGNSPFPANSQKDVCLNTPVNFDFSEPMLNTSFNDQVSFVLDSAGTAAAPLKADWNEVIGLNNWSFGGDFTYAQARPAQELKSYSLYSTRLFGGDANDDFKNALTDLCGNPLDGNANQTAEGSTLDNFYSAVSLETEQPITWETGENASCTPIVENIDPTFDYYGEEGKNPTLKISGKYLGPHPEVQFQGSTVWASGSFNTCFDANHLGNVETNTAKGSACIDDNLQTMDTILMKTPVGANDSNIKVTVAGETSEPAAQTIDVQSPYINNLSPSDGSIGQYVTISGDNYGKSRGTVLMRSADGIRSSTLELPNCGNVWTNKEIVAIIPQTYTNASGTSGVWQIGDVAYVQVLSADGAHYSDLQKFTFSDVVRPNLCEVIPSCDDSAGAHSFQLVGEGFGDTNADGSQAVYAYKTDQTEYLGQVSSWSDISVAGNTDANMPQGDYWVTVYDGESGLYSNGREYSNPCKTGPQVVEINSCSQTSGVYPVPNPQPFDTSACLNSTIGILFDQPIKADTLNKDTVILQQYNADGDFNSSYSPLLVGGYFEDYHWSYTYNQETYYGFKYNINKTLVDENQDGTADGDTSGNLQPNTWYQLMITGVQNDPQGTPMASSYIMRFKTDNTDQLCQVDSIDVAPSDPVPLNSFMAGSEIAHQNYSASPYDAACHLLDSTVYAWNWKVDDALIGKFGNEPQNDSAQNVYAVGDQAENTGNTKVHADIAQFSVTDEAKFGVDFAFCTNDSDCASCANSYGQKSTCNLKTNRCTPIIKSFKPKDGTQATAPSETTEAKPGTWTTITGCMFGAYKGNVYWNQNEQSTPTAWPNSTECENTWQDTQIIAEAPVELQKGLEYVLQVETQYGDSADTSAFGTFKVNDAIYPGLCSLKPNFTSEGQQVVAQGQNLGSEKGEASFLGETKRIPANSNETTWEPSRIMTTVPAGALSGRAIEGDPAHPGEGFKAILSGSDDQCQNPQSCSNPLDITISCKGDYDCATGCCSNGGVCQAANLCNTCDTDLDCTADNTCPGSICTNNVCSPVINDLFYNSGPQLSPVTVMGCYFGSYNSDTSAVTFGDQKANLACESGWSNNQIIAEVPKDLSLNQTVAIAVHTAASQTTADNDVNFTVTAQCANGANVPASTGVPLLCDLYPGSGQNAADDGSIQGTKVAFYGGRFNSEKQNNFFSNSLSGEVIADDYQYNSDTKTEGRVPAGIKASGISYVKTGTEQCKSNALAFGIECGSVTDCAQGSYCVDGYCTQNACGGCTIGTAESTCGNQQGCYYNNDLGENCCTERPTIVAMSIQDGETAVCPNRKVQVEFSEPMAQYSAIKIKKINFNDTGDIVTPTEVPVTVTPDSNQAEILIIQPQAGWQVNTEYSLEIQSNPADESGLVALASGLAIKTGAKTIFFTTAGSQCKPAKIALTSKETGASDYTFYAPNTSTAFIASMLSADDQLLEPTADMGWQFVWSPYYDEERCDNAAWVELPTTTASVDAEGNVQSDASADEQIITSGSENGKNTSITVTATPLSGSNWQASDISAENQGKATISTFFCPSDQVWEYKDTNSGDNTRQNFRLIYCTGDTLPRLGIDDKPTIVAGGANDKFFRQYLFINQDNKEQAFGIRVFENKKHLSPAMWYKYNVPNPGSPQSIQLDGYEAVQDGSSYYVAASNIIGTSLYDNIYLFTFNDEKTIEQIKTQVLDNLLFNINGLDYSQCEASDKQKLVRDTKRINDMGTLQRLIDDYYDEHLKYPKPKSQAFGSYAEALTTSVWPSWQGALGNVLKQSIPEDVYNIFYATDADLATPWDAGLTPWIYTGENNNIKDCENIPAEGVYFDEAGTCWDDVNKTFYCPKESFTYLWKVDPTDIDHAQKGYLFARMEYLSTATDNYSTIDQDLMDACDGIPNAQCECYNYGSVGISGESWEVVAP